MAQYAVRDSIRQVSTTSWIIANRISLTQTSEQVPGSWSDGNGSFFVASQSEDTPKDTSEVHPFDLVHDGGDTHAVWRIGEAFLKIVIPLSPDLTREHTTLEAMQKLDLEFNIPKVLFHGEWDGRYYLILSRVPGQTLNTLWPTLDKETKFRGAREVAEICADLSEMESNTISGIDGGHIPEMYMTARRSKSDFSSATLLRNCQDVGMDCSGPFVFYHCDLGPTNILVDLENEGALGIIDWECAGFVPREWITTKFMLAGGLEPDLDGDEEDFNCGYGWRKRVAYWLEKDGFSECAMQWVKWRARKDS